MAIRGYRGLAVGALLALLFWDAFQLRQTRQYSRIFTFNSPHHGRNSRRTPVSQSHSQGDRLRGGALRQNGDRDNRSLCTPAASFLAQRYDPPSAHYQTNISPRDRRGARLVHPGAHRLQDSVPTRRKNMGRKRLEGVSGEERLGPQT